MKQYLIPFLLFAGLLSIEQQALAQSNKYSIYYYRRASLFEQLPVCIHDIVFLGNSITDGAEWAELFCQPNIKNRGISGDITQGVLDRLKPIVKGEPAKLFLLIGINDVSRNIPTDTIVGNIEKIIDTLQKRSPETRIYLQSLLPVNDAYSNFKKHVIHWELVPKINKKLEALASHKAITYIDLFSHFTDEGGQKLNPQYTNDGLHLMGAGYVHWAKLIEKFIKE